jgi:hypothetical protein
MASGKDTKKSNIHRKQHLIKQIIKPDWERQELVRGKQVLEHQIRKGLILHNGLGIQIDHAFHIVTI